MFTVLLALLLWPSAPVDTTFVPAFDAGSASELRHLDGCRVRVRARLTAMSICDTGYRYSVASDRDDVTLELPRDGPDLTGATVTVEGKVRLVRHPPLGTMAGWAEVRIMATAARAE